MKLARSKINDVRKVSMKIYLQCYCTKLHHGIRLEERMEYERPFLCGTVAERRDIRDQIIKGGTRTIS